MNFRSFTVYFSFGVLMGASSLASARAEVLKWSIAVEEARRGNSELKAAEELARASEFNTRSAYSGFLPSLTATGAWDRSSSSTSTSSGKAVDAYSATLTASQTLFSGFMDRAKVLQAQANARVSQADRIAASAKVLSDLKSAFAAVLYAQKSIQLIQDIVTRRERNLRVVELRYESGRENKGSVLLSEAYLASARYDLLHSRQGLQVAQAQLARVLGREDSDDLEVTDDVPLSEPTRSIEFQSLVPSAPDHMQAVGREDAADAQVTLARSGFFPTLGISGSTGKSGSSWFPQNEKWSVGVNLSLPLFSGGKDYYGTRGAVAQRAAAIATRTHGDRDLLSRLREAHAYFVEAVEKLKVDESFRLAAVAREEIARNKYNNGLMSFDDWDIIENDLISRQKAVLVSQRDRIVAEANWEKIQGKGLEP